MQVNYIPILKAKKGEIIAFSNLAKDKIEGILPLFDFGRIADSASDTKWFQNAADPIEEYFIRTSRNIADVLAGKEILFDIFQWPPGAATRNGQHVAECAHDALARFGVSAIPIVGCDRWESDEYRAVIKDLISSCKGVVCLRLDPSIMEDADDISYIEDLVSGIIVDLHMKAVQCWILMDFGDLNSQSKEDIVNRADSTAKMLHALGVRTVGVAGCSIPSSVDKAVSRTDSSRLLRRTEMEVWRDVKSRNPSLRIIMSDYAVRGPTAVDGIVVPHMNGKIRYCTEGGVLIIRGHSRKFDGGTFSQMHNLARQLIDSEYYAGAESSWGDKLIWECANDEFRGNPTNWVAIDTNRHITYVLSEIEEQERVSVAIEEETLLI